MRSSQGMEILLLDIGKLTKLCVCVLHGYSLIIVNEILHLKGEKNKVDFLNFYHSNLLSE